MSEYRTRAKDETLALLQKRIRELMNTTTDVVAGGGAKNFPEYTKMTGVIEGFALAERELLDLDIKLDGED